jgi:hypothetical protein
MTTISIEEEQVVYTTNMLRRLVGALENTSDWNDEYADLCSDATDLIDTMSVYAEDCDVEELDFNDT